MADDIKCFPAALEYLERGRDIFRPSNFKFGRFKAKRAGRSPSVTHLNHRGRVSDVGHDRQPAKTGEDFAQEFDSLACKLDLLDRQASHVSAGSAEARDNAIADCVKRTYLPILELLPPPAFCECCHRGLTRRLVAVDRRVVFVAAIGQRPQPWTGAAVAPPYAPSARGAR